MQNLVIKIFDIYKELGFLGVVSMIFIIVAAFLIYDLGKKLNEKIALIPFLNRKKIRIKNSTVFERLNFFQKFRVNKIRVDCPLRKKIFSDIVLDRIDKLRSKLLEVSNMQESKINEMNNDEMYNFWENLLYSASSESNAVLLFNGVPSIAIKKYDSFDFTENDILKKFFERVIYCDSVYDNNVEKFIAIMDFLGITIDILLMNIEKSIHQINGDLNNVEYRNYSCKNCRADCEHKNKKEDK